MHESPQFYHSSRLFRTKLRNFMWQLFHHAFQWKVFTPSNKQTRCCCRLVSRAKLLDPETSCTLVPRVTRCPVQQGYLSSVQWAKLLNPAPSSAVWRPLCCHTGWTVQHGSVRSLGKPSLTQVAGFVCNSDSVFDPIVVRPWSRSLLYSLMRGRKEKNSERVEQAIRGECRWGDWEAVVWLIAQIREWGEVVASYTIRGGEMWVRSNSVAD